MSEEKTVVQVEGRTLTLTNLGKVLYPETGFTKAEVIHYYQQIAPVLVPHIAGRPATLKRYPEGVDGQSFFQKHAPEHRPDWVRTEKVNSSSSSSRSRGQGTLVEYVVIDDLPTLIWAANLASLEFHVPMWRFPDVGRPDLLVFDLDPGLPATIVECCRVAEALRPALEARKLKPLPKTSGGKGLQLYAAVSGMTSDETSELAKSLAGELEGQQPDLIVSRMTKSLRDGKVLIDWSQNSASKTTVAPYSLRARARPTVSTPVTWDEVAACRKVSDLVFTADDVPARVEANGDLLAALLELRGAFLEQQQSVGGQRRIVGDPPVAGHPLELGSRHPLLSHVLLLLLTLRRARLQAGGEEEIPALAGDPVRAVQEAEPGQVVGAQAGLLDELEPGQFLRRAGGSWREPALRKRPAAPAERVAELLDQVEPVVFLRYDQGEVLLLDERVNSARPVAPLDFVAAQPHPRVLIDDRAGQRLDVWGHAAHYPVTALAGFVGAGPYHRPMDQWTILRGLADAHVPAVAPAPRSGQAPVAGQAPGCCVVCRGPAGGGFARCYQCNRHVAGGGQLLADVVAPIGYAVRGSAFADDLWRYKANVATSVRVPARDRLRALLLVFLHDRARQLLRRAGMTAPDLVAVVPSGRGRPGAHPMRELAAPFLRIAWIPLTVRPEFAARGRDLDHRWLRVDGSAAGASVLLIDDTWVSGGSVQSAAVALKLAGAARVSIIVLGRHLNPADPLTAPFLASLRPLWGSMSHWPRSSVLDVTSSTLRKEKSLRFITTRGTAIGNMIALVAGFLNR
jgi:bifunctional non-homologous end joining protein LigD